MDASENRNAISSYLLASKDKQGQEVRLLNVTIPTAVAATGTGKDESNFDIPISQGLYRNVANMPQGYSLRYMIPTAGLGAILDSGGKPTEMELIVPNPKLIELFQQKGPNVTPEAMTKVQSEIEKKLNPFALHIGITAMEGGMASLVRDGGCLKSVDLRKCKQIWAYYALSLAKIDSERDKANPNHVFMKVTIPMADLNKVAVPYANYMAK